jgi:hypothetical protein
MASGRVAIYGLVLREIARAETFERISLFNYVESEDGYSVQYPELTKRTVTIVQQEIGAQQRS